MGAGCFSKTTWRRGACDGGLFRTSVERAALWSKQPHLFSLKTIRGRHCRQLEPVIKGFLGPAEGRPRRSDLSALCWVDEDRVWCIWTWNSNQSFLPGHLRRATDESWLSCGTGWNCASHLSLGKGSRCERLHMQMGVCPYPKCLRSFKSNDTKAKWPSNGTMAPLRSETRLVFEATSKEHEKERRLILLPNLALVPDHGDSCIEVYRRLKPNIATSWLQKIQELTHIFLFPNDWHSWWFCDQTGPIPRNIAEETALMPWTGAFFQRKSRYTRAD